MSNYPTDYYYQYTPLKSRFIRLVRLHAGHGPKGLSGQLEIELEECSLADADYDALSYTWGPATLEEQEELASQIFTTVARCYPVMCDGKIILVTRSLRNALFRLRCFEDLELAEYIRQTQNCQKSPYTWIDGICINQDDIAERNQQVAMMAELYSKARMTIAYLGEPDEYTRAALQTVIMLANLSQTMEDEMETISSTDHLNPTLFARIDAQPPTTDEWWNLCIFLSREWFRRTWIVQEAILSQGTNAIILCGELTAKLGAVLLGASLVACGEVESPASWTNATIETQEYTISEA